MANPQINPESTPSPFVYHETPMVSRCSSLTCSNSHTWALEAQTALCPGCKSPILAIKMVNCPQCNEPSTSLTLRSDHLSRGSAITPICQGSASLAEINKIELKLNHAALEQQNHVVRALPEKI